MSPEPIAKHRTEAVLVVSVKDSPRNPAKAIRKGDTMNEFLKEWLEMTFSGDGYEVEGEPHAGTYGQVWIMRATRPNVSPPRFALKTLDPEKLGHKLHGQDLRNFERK